MTAGRRSRRRERSTSLRDGAPPPPRPGHVPPARARRRLIVTATGIGGAGLLGISLSAKAGSPQFYILTTGLAGLPQAVISKEPPAAHKAGTRALG
jgi:hypothetical protein